MNTQKEPEDFIYENIEVLREEITYFIKSSELKIEEEKDYLAQIVLPFKQATNDLKKETNRLLESKNSSSAFRVTAVIGLLNSQLDSINAQLSLKANIISQSKGVTTVWNKVSASWNTLVGRLKSIIQTISSYLWQLISRLLTLREWSISGTVSTPSITSLFGPSGSATIQITFG